MNKLRSLVEYNLFGVCSYLGEKFNIASSKIRLYFIYLSFLTFGSPVIFYFFLVFWMNMRRYMQNMKRNPLWNA
ncbi:MULTISPECIES: PspC domain-containing protein [Phnomibacter]|jgi:phage shock protein PspC (stress-responsive transcriptional regulator)|uniref:PspC domain-containing protein n=1 Tax=Phnomibacter ginsenosidimutans TaxID=2676868 RepID=A0A6I6G6K2_9BACT|nr:PspC domain-containing protein [Phnomibacter ginsenosidimutans]MCA0383092.1 PspC domain-containing protein [Bacteroidota bacterium]QGW27714.1 PspC domain-containing protein [Phnomibacter ginsenosidimutans]